MRNRFLWMGVMASLLLHLGLWMWARGLDPKLPRRELRTVKLRLAKRQAKERRDEERVREAQRRIEEALETPAIQEDDVETLRQAEEAQKRLEELRRKLEAQEEKRLEEERKKLEEVRKELPVQPVRPPEVTQQEKRVEPKTKEKTEAEKKPAKKKPAKKKKRSQDGEKPAEGGKKKAPPGREGEKRGAPIDLDYTMSGGTGGEGGDGGGSLPIETGDGFDVPEEGWSEEGGEGGGTGAGSGEETAGSAGEEEFQDNLGEEEALADEEGGAVPGEGVGGAARPGRKKDPRARKVKTESKHRVTRDARMKAPPRLVYPESIKALEIQGWVYLLVTVDKAGKVANVQVKRGLHPVLDKTAVEAAWKLEFEPAMVAGEPVGVKITVPFTFVLE